MTLPPLSQWNGWLHHFGYVHADPFSRPLPIPASGIFDTPDIQICFNSEWKPLLLGALTRLAYEELYIKDDSHDGIWARNQIEDFMGAFTGTNPCQPQSIEATECAYYPSYYAGIEYIPYNPFSDTTLPSGYNVAPFFRFNRIDTWFPNWIDDWFHGVIENTTGYLENDVFVSFFSLPTLTNPFDGLDYPTLKITVQGEGTMKLRFLLVPFGGRALITFDPPDVTDIFNSIWSTEDRIIELNRDVVSLIPETDLDAIEEVKLVGDTTHTVYVTFLPTINDESPVFQFGGGFRGFEICGGLTLIDPATDLPVDPTDPLQEGTILVTQEEFCAYVEDCLSSSQTILDIQNDVTTLETQTSQNSAAIQQNATAIGNNLVDIQANDAAITNLQSQVSQNIQNIQSLQNSSGGGGALQLISTQTIETEQPSFEAVDVTDYRYWKAIVVAGRGSDNTGARLRVIVNRLVVVWGMVVFVER